MGRQKPNGIALTPDQGTLAVSDDGGRYTWVWRIEPDGSLSHRQPYITLRTPAPDLPSKGDGMTTDAVGRFYVDLGRRYSDVRPDRTNGRRDRGTE